MGVPHHEGPADVSLRPGHGSVARAYYCRTHSLDADHVDAALHVLSADERRRCGWIFRDTDRRDYVAAHALLRAALALHTGVEPDHLALDKDAAGRPSLVPPDPEGDAPTFSLSHTPGLVACVIASDRDAVGIDVETIDPSVDVRQLAGHVCSADELADLRNCAVAARPTRFFQLWTLKEALLKAQGVGLQGMTRLVSFRVEGMHVRASLPATADHRCWSFLQTPIGATHVLAIATARPATPMSVRVIGVDPVAAMSGALVPLES